jgi:class 3 adenylate cyclase
MQTRFAKTGAAHVAYRVFGDGPQDLLCMLGEYIPVDAIDEEPRYARCMNRLASMGRVIVFNPRGIGLSDGTDGDPTPDQHADDALAVLDAVGSPRATLFAWNVAGPTAIRFATKHTDRTAALILVNSFARLLADTDYFGFPEELVTTTAAQTTDTDANADTVPFDFLSAFAPSVANDQRFRTWWEQAGHRGASPARSRALWTMMMRADMRDDLRLVVAPTLVMNRTDLAAVPVALGRYLGDHIAGARFVELPGADLMWWVGDADAVLDEIESFIGSAGTAPRPRRRLATVLFVDVVGSTERAVSIGDRRWRELLDTYHEVARRAVGRFEGNEIGTAGDGMLATFEMPADAISCATAITENVQALGINVRAGVHTGEIEIVGADVAGIGVHIAARVMSAATAGEVWVSRTVTDLVAGSRLRFSDRGSHVLRGVPGEWQLFAVVP